MCNCFTSIPSGVYALIGAVIGSLLTFLGTKINTSRQLAYKLQELKCEAYCKWLVYGERFLRVSTEYWKKFHEDKKKVPSSSEEELALSLAEELALFRAETVKISLFETDPCINQKVKELFDEIRKFCLNKGEETQKTSDYLTKLTDFIEDLNKNYHFKLK